MTPLWGEFGQFSGKFPPFRRPGGFCHKRKLVGMQGMAPSWALSTLLCNQIRPGLRKIRFKSRRRPSPHQTKPLPIGPARLGKFIFDRFLVIFVHWASGFLYYFYRKRPICTISHSPELSIFSVRQIPMRLARWAQLTSKKKPGFKMFRPQEDKKACPSQQIFSWFQSASSTVLRFFYRRVLRASLLHRGLTWGFNPCGWLARLAKSKYVN